MPASSPNIDEREIARFSAAAPNWWDRRGEFKALHDINPVRLAFVAEHADLNGRKVLDVGCGGGLVAEGLSAAGALVTAIDMSATSLTVARRHLEQSGLTIDYRQTTAEAIAKDNPATFDVVTCMELVEHVPDPFSVVRACSRAVKAGGHVFFATLNRTWSSYLFVILASEYILGIMRKGTHHYQRLVKPSEMVRWGRAAGLSRQHLCGLRYLPLLGYTSLCKSTRMNYLMHFIKPLQHKRKHRQNGSVGESPLV